MPFNKAMPAQRKPADTIVAKRFERQTVMKNRVYDHRSLGEMREQMEFDIEVECRFKKNTTTTLD